VRGHGAWVLREQRRLRGPATIASGDCEHFPDGEQLTSMLRLPDSG
jgi:hypothetical protein